MVDINQLATGTEPSSSWRPHPLGTYQGKVVEVRQETTKQGTPVWKIVCQTARGQAEGSVFGFTQNDLARADADPKFLDQIKGSIGRAKRLLGDLGVATDENLRNAGWDNGHGSVTGYLGQAIIGARCQVSVQPKQGEPNKQVVFINRFQDVPDQEIQPPAGAAGFNGGGQAAAPDFNQAAPANPAPHPGNFEQPPAAGGNMPSF